MDFLKSAVASAISKGPAFGYTFGDRVDIDDSIWTLYNGIKREDGSKCSIFSFDATGSKSRLPLARNALRKLRTLRHPGVVKVLDTVETDAYIYIATERLSPLSWHVKRKSLTEETIKWGLHNVAKTLKFVNTEATSIHGCIRPASIFFSESGEWKLGGFDALSSVKEDDSVLPRYGSAIPDARRYMPPEVSKGGWEVIKQNPTHAVDSYNFGTLIFEVFNGSFQGSDQLGQMKSIPPSIQQAYKRLLNANPKSRMSVGQFLDQGKRLGGFFQTPLIQVTEDIENIGLKSEDERNEVLGKLDEVADDFPADFFKMKVLPELLKSVEFGGGGAKVFGTVMQIGAKLSDEEYETQITPVVVRLFANPDRAIRVCLLNNLPLMIDHLPQKIVNNQIFPQLVTGFTDVAPVVREETVKAVLVIVPKLSDRVVNGELLRHLAKTANDEQAGIRTNTTICLGKIARNLGANNRAKVLSAAFARSLRDPFVHARNAALMALSATADLFSEEDCASKLLPVMCPSLVDKEKMIRDQAQKTVDIYITRIRKYTATMPDTVLPSPSITSASGGNAVPRMGTPANDSTWTGWAISSFTNKLAAASGQMQAGAATNGSADQRSHSVPPPAVPTASKPTLTPSSRPGMTLTKSAASIPTMASPDPVDAFNDETEDFDGDWGGFGDDDAFGTSSSASKKQEEEDDPWGAPNVNSAPANFDDKGEPDFAGWLAAQNQSKKTVTKTLPKGLAKSGTATKKPVVARTAGAPNVKRVVVAQPKKEVKTPEPHKNEEEDEGWGDAW
ncbi:Nuclear aminoacylation-dependent tRNA export pathway component [Didymosphaeria variabile]|uniref:Nuclear aminoacylation-dependent tRNA export pathway component n=1 Tax=Didymosphaeria variabile TaxID=1932322 RepID=A0A9W8XUE2_9PLEO|nr:Nuclear aminoacylation-dependent tRNA export pathway component [Didymosphaeria variabile]KAJ4357647.1 Nuclear aminoacylation-dependent tRNA export pathway component [Didymosphaeria variabile]